MREFLLKSLLLITFDNYLPLLTPIFCTLFSLPLSYYGIVDLYNEKSSKFIIYYSYGLNIWTASILCNLYLGFI